MSKPTFIFHTQQARRLGLEAAIVLAFVQEQIALQGPEAETLTATEAQWLDWLPFLSPARFWAATETLIDTGWLRRVDAGPGNLGLTLSRQASAAAEPAPPATAAPDTEREPQRSMKTDTGTTDTLDDYDMPPPMPALSPLLTDRTSHIEQAAGTPRRYSDEPLYAMATQTHGAADTSPAAGSAQTSNQPGSRPGESTVMTLSWQPGEDCLAMIRNRGIDSEFALAQRESFVLYYRDSGQRHMSWDTKFFNWVSRRWQYHLNDSQNDFRATAPDRETSPRERRQKVRERLRNIGDVDW